MNDGYTYSGGVTMITVKKHITNLALLLAASICSATPVILVAPTNSDAGNINQGEPVNFSVEVYNKGDQTLKLSATSGCNCGKVDVEPLVPPKEMVLLKYLVQTNDMQGKTTRSVQLHSNDPKHPNINLIFRMNVKAPIWLEPTEPTLINLTAGAIAKRTFMVKSSSQAPVVLGEPSGLPQYCTARVQGNRVILTVTPYAPYGRSGFTANIPVIKPTEGSVNAVVAINKGIVSEPASLYLGSSSTATVKPMKSRVVLNAISPFTVSAVTAPRELAVVVKKIRPNSWAVEVTMTKPLAKGIYRNTVVLKTNQPGQSSLRIPVVAIRY